VGVEKLYAGTDFVLGVRVLAGRASIF
jgi:hypothetical protein